MELDKLGELFSLAEGVTDGGFGDNKGIEVE